MSSKRTHRLLIVDGRNLLNPEDCEKTGFTYRGVGVGLRRRRRYG